jgi:hypothetical protein
MVTGPVEWIVTIFAIIGLVKLIAILVNRQKWFNFARKVYSKPTITGVIALVLAAVVFWFLMQQMTIVEIMAVATFVALLTVFGFMTYSEEALALGEKFMEKKFSGGLWLYILIWAVLLLWALWEIFF